MRLAMPTDYYFDFTPEEALRHLFMSGWKCSELSSEHSEDLMAKSGNPGKTGREYGDCAKNYGIDLHQGHLLLHSDIACENQNELIETLKRWLELYLAIGIKSAVLHPGGNQLVKEKRDKAWINDRRSFALRELTSFLKGTDLTICLENIPGAIEDAEGLLELIGISGSENLGICLDTGHLNLSRNAGGSNTLQSQGEFIRKSGKYLKALHIHDNQGKTDQHILPFGCGTVNWREVANALKEIGYADLFNLEIPHETRAPLEIRYAKSEYIFKMYDLMFNDKIYINNKLGF